MLITFIYYSKDLKEDEDRSSWIEIMDSSRWIEDENN
jgi:hypothetical protein